MRGRDFFSYCTSLRPIELKTVGELSWVRHIAQGEVLYSPGEPGNALYIVNRGILEVLSQKGHQDNKVICISRGDLIGDVEVFADIKRTQLVRAKEDSSLQCFPRANFPELLRLVPSFYRHLCEQMAFSLLKERDVAGEADRHLELSGRISNFDLTTIYQTIMSSGQTGELDIKDEHAQTVGAYYFEAGRLGAGKFQHLTGEEAFLQLFQNDKLAGSFSFSVGERRETDWIEAGRINKKNGDALIVALQFRDELEALKKGMHQHTQPLRLRTSELKWEGGTPEELKALAKQIWDLLVPGPRSIAELYRQCSVCELKLYQVVTELIYSEQVTFTGTQDRRETAEPPSPKTEAAVAQVCPA